MLFLFGTSDKFPVHTQSNGVVIDYYEHNKFKKNTDASKTKN